MGHPGVYTWTTAYTPSNATLPITYLWDNGNTAANTTRTLGIGAYTLTVTATNCVHTVMGDTHQVVIHGWEVYLPVVLRQFP